MSKKSHFARSLPQVSSIQQLDHVSRTHLFPSLTTLFYQPPQQHQENLQKKLLLFLFIVILSDWLIMQLIDTFLIHKDSPRRYLSQGFAMLLIIASFIFSWAGLIKIPQESKRFRPLTLMLASLCFFSSSFLTRLIFAQRAFSTNLASDWCSLVFNFTVSTVVNIIVPDLLFQEWILKLIPPFGNVCALTVAHFTAQNENLVFEWWTVLAASTCVFLLLCMKIRTIRDEHTKIAEDKNWNSTYSLMLSHVPSAVAVICLDERILYNNHEFEKLSVKYENSLLDKIISVESMTPDLSEAVRFPRTSPKAEQTDSHISLVKQFAEDNDAFNSDQEAQKSPVSPSSITSTTTLNEAIQLVRSAPYTSTSFAFKGKLGDLEGLYPTMPLDIKICKILDRTDIILILSETASRDLLVPLENANEYKNKLLATVSHEMRTPLNGNLSLVECAMNDEMMPQHIKDKYLMPAYRSGQLLWHLVNDVLDIAQIQARKLRLSFERLSLRATIENCCKLLEIKAQTKDVALVMELGDDLPELFNTDHNRLSQIILNLLGNALKFTFTGGEVRIKVNVIAPTLLEFIVKDTGIGMSSEDLEKLFRHFTRINYGKRKNINTTGVGLGLSIANNLVKMFGGPGSRGINVKSAPEQGSTFSFMLRENKPEEDEDNIISPKEVKSAGCPQDSTYSRKFHRSESRTTTQEGCTDERFECATISNQLRKPYESPSPKNFRKLSNNLNQSRFKSLLKAPHDSWKREQSPKRHQRTVLVVDDEPFNVLALDALLKPFGFTVEGAYSGQDAIEKILNRLEEGSQINYKMVFMDCQMPMMTGYEATAIIKRIFEERGIEEVPIIGCSGFQNKEHYVRSMKSGMKEVLVKPVSKERIAEVLKKYFECDL